MTVTRLYDLAMEYARRTFRDPETRQPTGHHRNWHDGLRHLAELYPQRDPATLQAPDFQALQDHLVDRGTCNITTINNYTRHMRRILKWASKRVRGYIPKTVLLEAEEVEYLKPGETAAKEPADRRIATWPQIEAVMTFASTLYLRQMVELHALTGMRSSELVRMRRSWIRPVPPELFNQAELTRGMMLYEPRQHKTRKRGKRRLIVIGPRGAEVLRDHLKRLPADRERVWPITTSNAYYQAVTRAGKRAELDQPITALMIRRYAGYTIRRVDGLDAAQQALGHAHAKTTELYAPPDLTKLIDAMHRHG
ncbi:MAG: tyrosine-type recombinase/integrase [Planctomycetota bacterium]